MKSRIFTFAAGLAGAAVAWSGWSAAAQIGGRGPIVQQSPNGGIVRTVPTRQPGGGLTPTPSPSPAPTPPPATNPGWTVSPGGIVNNTPISPIRPVANAVIPLAQTSDGYRQFMENVNNFGGFRDPNVPWYDEDAEEALIDIVGPGVNQHGRIEQPLVGFWHEADRNLLSGGSIWVGREYQGRKIYIRYGVLQPVPIAGNGAVYASNLTVPLKKEQWEGAVAPYSGGPARNAMFGFFGNLVGPRMQTAYANALRFNPNYIPVASTRVATMAQVCPTCAKNLFIEGSSVVLDIKEVDKRVVDLFPKIIQVQFDTLWLCQASPVREAGKSLAFLQCTTSALPVGYSLALGNFQLQK